MVIFLFRFSSLWCIRSECNMEWFSASHIINTGWFIFLARVWPRINTGLTFSVRECTTCILRGFRFLSNLFDWLGCLFFGSAPSARLDNKADIAWRLSSVFTKEINWIKEIKNCFMRNGGKRQKVASLKSPSHLWDLSVYIANWNF